MIEPIILVYVLHGEVITKRFKLPRLCWLRELELTVAKVEIKEGCSRSYRNLNGEKP